MQRKYKEKCKKAAQPTSKQDGQFMAIHAAQAKQDMNHKTSSCPKCHSLHQKNRPNKHKTCMHHPCLDKTIPGHETVQTMEINIAQRKYKEKYKRQLNPTSKQDGQFMAIHAAQAKQDMNHKTSSCPKCHSASKNRPNKHKTCMHHPCLDKTIHGHKTLQTMEINITQRKYKEQYKKAAQPTSKQDGQFMAIHAAQAKQDMNHKTSSCPKCHSLHLKKGRTSQIKQAQNVHAPSVS